MGEHHRADFAVTAPEVVLAAIARFEAEADEGSLYVGSPETVAQRIAGTVATLGVDRFELKYSSGTLGHDKLLGCIGHYGEQVVPRVRELLAAQRIEPTQAEATPVESAGGG